MSEWKMFPLWEYRPESIRPLSKKRDRHVLEITIAYQVADLLSRHGQISEVEVDMSASLYFDEPSTFEVVELENIPLEDGGDLIIGQVPFSADGFCTTAGAHSVCKQDADGVDELNLMVWDPSIVVPRRICDERGKVVRRVVLHELYEAMTIIVPQYDAESAGNMPPLRVTDYPKPVIDPVFQALFM